IRAKAGVRQGLELATKNRGHSILAHHDFIDAFSAEVSEDDLARLAADPRVVSISFDAAMQGDQVATDSPLTLIAERTAKGTTATAPNPAALRGTLGLTSSTWTGKGVTGALLDLVVESQGYVAVGEYACMDCASTSAAF